MIFETTKKNYFEYGTNLKPFRLRSSAKDIWFTNHHPASRQPQSFREECISTARLITEIHPQPTLLISGGLDSEVMAHSFLQAGKKFNAAIMAFKNGLNQHDVNLALETVKRLNIPYQIYELDLFQFIKSKEAADYAQKLWIRLPWIMAHMWLLKTVDGFPVMGCGDCYLERHSNRWYLLEREQYATWFHFLRLINKPGVSHFFAYTAETRLSFLQEPQIKELCSNTDSINNSTATKYAVYQTSFGCQPRPKLHGFEHIKAQKHEEETTYLQNLYPDCFAEPQAFGSIHYHEYHSLIRQLTPRS